MDLSVIIINYNTKKLTLQSIASVYEYTRCISFEIIVVDNASQESIIPYVESRYPEVRVIANEQNIGFGRANNQAIKIANGKFVFLLNSDAFLTSNSLNSFYEYMNKPENQRVAACGADLISDNNEARISFGSFPSLTQGFLEIGFFVFLRKYFYQKLAIAIVNYDDKIKEVDYITGADVFIRKSVFDEIGMFDPDFFLYFEETELFFRIKKAGYNSVILPSEKIIHLEGFSQINQDRSFNYTKYEMYAKSRNMFFNKCYGALSAKIAKLIYSVKLIVFTLGGKERRQGEFIKKLRIIYNS